MSNIIPQDFSDVKNLLSTLLEYAINNNNTEMREKIQELITEYEAIMEEPKASEKIILPYNRKDAYSIFEYLKLQAEQLSGGRWTDFSDSDIGTVFLKLMSYLADMNNFQTDKVTSELYLDTAMERSSMIALAKLVGYEPRHYLSATTEVKLAVIDGQEVPYGTIIPEYTVFTDSSNEVNFTTLRDYTINGGSVTVTAYEGVPTVKTYTINDISTTGKIILSDYNIGLNTIKLFIDGKEYEKVDDVRFISGELGFSVHMSEDAYLYIQLPSYWPDVTSRSSNIVVRYLLCNGEDGRIGKNILTRIEQMASEHRNKFTILSNTATIGGYNPETVDEMRDSIPKWARTMNTIVTINDFEEVATAIPGIQEVQALDYNDPSSGLVQPDDYYKVYLYVLPDADNTNYDPMDVTYRNTIIKERDDWEYSDMNKVADFNEEYSKASIAGVTITLTDAATRYSVDNIAFGLNKNTNNEDDNYLLKPVDTITDTTTFTQYTITQSGSDYIITLQSNWRNFVENNQYLDVFFLTEQVLTNVGQELREYIDDRRLTSLQVTYHPLEIVHPDINVDVYMNADDIRYDTTAEAIKEFLFERFSRKNMKIGEPLFESVIGHEILDNFDYLRYVEVNSPSEKLEVVPNGFIDVVPTIYDTTTGDVVDKIVITMHDYQNRII